MKTTIKPKAIARHIFFSVVLSCVLTLIFFDAEIAIRRHTMRGICPIDLTVLLFGENTRYRADNIGKCAPFFIAFVVVRSRVRGSNI